MDLVIVGGSLAGLRAAQSARRVGHTGSLVVIGQEPHPPYNRPPLSKDLLTGAIEPERTAFPLGDLDVDWRLGVPAVRLDRKAHEVVLADGTTVGYDRVILATGCRARRFPIPGDDRTGVVTLRDLDDALALRDRLKPGSRLLIVGAGFIGCEVAASARRLDVEVTLVDIAAHPMLPLGPVLGDRWVALHRENGVDLRLGVGVAELQGKERVELATLTDGSAVPVDAVLLSLGSQLNTEWLADAGLELNPGVVTDATLTSTVDPDVLVAGDIAACPVGLAGGAPLRIEHWTTAAEHGLLAGPNALLDPADRRRHAETPYFWSDQYGLKIQAVGLPGLGQETVTLEASPDGHRFVTASVLEDRVLGVVAFNAAKRLAWYRMRLTEPLSLETLREAVAAEPAALGPATNGAPSPVA